MQIEEMCDFVMDTIEIGSFQIKESLNSVHPVKSSEITNIK